MNILTALLASAAINGFFFFLAARMKTDVFTDITYSLTFAVLAVLGFVFRKGFHPEQAIVMIFVLLWAARLGSYLFRRILKTGVDHRFDAMRDKPSEFGKFWALQAVTVWIVMLPALGLYGAESIAAGEFLQRILLVAGSVLWISGFLIEAVADGQKYAFKNKPENAGKFMNQGLWKHARHPNYFGEILAWWGVALVALPFLSGWRLLYMAGPVFITVLLLFVSGVPLLEKSWEEKWGGDPAFREYKASTRLRVPLPKKGGGGGE